MNTFNRTDGRVSCNAHRQRGEAHFSSRGCASPRPCSSLVQGWTEGVETEEQLHCLKKEGCDLVQGYLFSRPVSSTALFEMITPAGQNCI